MTFREAHAAAAKLLLQAGIEEASLDAMYLLEEACHLNRTQFLCRRDEVMEDAQKTIYMQWIHLREQRIPLQHITGRQEFMGYTFSVTPDVLIPRQDTEVLVETAFSYLQSRHKDRLAECMDGWKDQNHTAQNVSSNLKVLDVCTGSGCIVISLAKMYPQAQYTGIDLSAAALAVAQKNAHDLDAKVMFGQGDLFAACPDHTAYDLIVSNPPYIATDVIKDLQPEVRDHDPMMALDGGADGLVFYRRIVREAKEYLKEQGMLMMEIGSDQGRAVCALLQDAGYSDVACIRDLSGLDRVVLGRFDKETQRQ